MKVKPFNPQNKYTTFENVIIDYLLPKIPPNAWKCLTLIIRKTVGWHKDRDKISFSQIKQGTGIKNNGTISKALKDLEDLGIIQVIRSPDQWKTNTYILNTDFEIDIPSTENVPEDAPPSTEIVLEPSTENVPDLVQKSYTQKKGLKKSKEKESTTKRLDALLEKINKHWGPLSKDPNHKNYDFTRRVMAVITKYGIPSTDAAVDITTIARHNGTPRNWGYVEAILKKPDYDQKGQTNGQTSTSPSQRSTNGNTKRARHQAPENEADRRISIINL